MSPTSCQTAPPRNWCRALYASCPFVQALFGIDALPGGSTRTKTSDFRESSGLIWIAGMAWSPQADTRPGRPPNREAWLSQLTEPGNPAHKPHRYHLHNPLKSFPWGTPKKKLPVRHTARPGVPVSASLSRGVYANAARQAAISAPGKIPSTSNASPLPCSSSRKPLPPSSATVSAGSSKNASLSTRR